MILVTGGAGFIGSNLHAALVRRGHETVIVDSLGDAGKWRNLAKHPPSRLIPPAAGDGVSSRRDLQHDVRRWRHGLGDECRDVAAHVALVSQSRRTADVCIV